MENTYNIQNLLNYDEISNMEKDMHYRYHKVRSEFEKLTDKVVEEHIKLNTTDVDVAYRFQFKVIDNMNIVGKITNIPIMDVVLRQPIVEDEFVYNQPRKFTWKERLQILLKGQI